MKFTHLVLTLAAGLLLAACSSKPTPPPVVPANPQTTPTAISLPVAAVKTPAPPLAATTPTVGASVTPPPPPGATAAAAAETPPAPPTLSLALSPSVTPVPAYPTRPVHPTAGPPTATPSPQVSEDALRGKILFRSTRNGGKYPNGGNYFIMDGDGGNVQQVPTNDAQALYQQLKPQEGYSPDHSQLVVGERTCNPTGHCDLYLGDPQVVVNRSQGSWTPTGANWSRADNPAWSPDGNWIIFTWNRDNDRTKNIFKGEPFAKNQDFKRLTDFGGHRDTKDPTWSPDSSLVAFATQDNGHWQIWVLDASADNPGSANAHNLSNSSYDDWSPLWIK